MLRIFALTKHNVWLLDFLLSSIVVDQRIEALRKQQLYHYNGHFIADMTTNTAHTIEEEWIFKRNKYRRDIKNSYDIVLYHYNEHIITEINAYTAHKHSILAFKERIMYHKLCKYTTDWPDNDNSRWYRRCWV